MRLHDPSRGHDCVPKGADRVPDAQGRTAVLLAHFGGPESLAEVQPFLEGILSDPHVITFPRGLRWLGPPLARRIAARRAAASRAMYEAIGGASPINRWTRDLALALQRRRPDLVVTHGNRYSSPPLGMAAHHLAARGAARIIVCPLYPQFAGATTGSALAECLDRPRLVLRPPVAGELPACLQGVPFGWLRPFHDDPGYLELVARQIRETLATGEAEHLLFTAHGLPLSHQRRGDPYAAQVRATMEGALARLSAPPPASLAFQSRLGPARWLAPYADAEVRRLAAAGVRRLVVCPLSFVCDHVETLYELDILLAQRAREAGITSFRRVPPVGRDPAFAELLLGLIDRALRN